MASVTRSPTLAANERVRARIAAGRPVIHLAFGEAGLPLHPSLRRELEAAAGRHRYPPVAGTPALLQAVVGYFARRRLPTEAQTVVVGPGSKPLLYALMLAIEGDLVLPVPSWVSYEPQATLAGKAVIRVPIPDESGGVPDPELLEDAIAAARHEGHRPSVLLLTVPDNPTGTIASAAMLAQVCAIARAEGILVISDEIYRDLAHEPDTFASPAELYPEGTVVTGGLSKSLSLGGWRLGFVRMPQTEHGEALTSTLTNLASEIWSGTAAPIQEVGAFALDEPAEILDFVARGRRLHAHVARALYDALSAAGARCRPPQGGFYLYPELTAPGFSSSVAVADHLLEHHDIAVLPGDAFGDEPAALRFRFASSLLYGADDAQRWEALNAASPAGLPWISEAIAQVGAALDGLRTSAAHQKP